MKNPLRICALALLLTAAACSGDINGDGGDGDGDDGDAGIQNLELEALEVRVLDLTPFTVPLSPIFDGTTEDYSVGLRLLEQRVAITATAKTPSTVEIRVAGITLESGVPSEPITLPSGTSVVDVVVAGAGGLGEQRTYQLTMDRGNDIEQALYGKAEAAIAGGGYGASVSSDDKTLVVGAPLELVPGSHNGAAYVYVWKNDSWQLQARIPSPTCCDQDYFGEIVAIDGDTLVVSARQDASDATGVNGDPNNNNAIQNGAAHVYTRTGEVWTHQAYLKAPQANRIYFGWGLAISGDLVAVSRQSRLVQLFERNGTTWTPLQTIAPDISFFGWSVALDGNRLLIGSAFETANGLDNIGAVYVYEREQSGQFAMVHRLTTANPIPIGQFGSVIASDGDTFVVGAKAQQAPQEPGAASVFELVDGVWKETVLLNPNGDGGDTFGVSLAIRDDVVVIGSHREDSAANPFDNLAQDSGAVFVFSKSGEGWEQRAYLKASNVGAGDSFGGSVVVTGAGIVVGASAEDSAAGGFDGDQANDSSTNSGAIYLFR